MSRGLGRVQRGVLDALQGGPLDLWTLAVTVRASEDSTGRALRSLQRSGQVACLGFGLRRKRWGLRADVAARRDVWEELWPAKREANMAAVMGWRFARAFRRSLVTAL